MKLLNAKVSLSLEPWKASVRKAWEALCLLVYAKFDEGETVRYHIGPVQIKVEK
jgi:hypothetical protein